MSLAQLKRRCETLAATLSTARETPAPRVSSALDPRPWVITGVGASEGPARFYAARLAAMGRPVRFASMTAVNRGLTRHPDAVLVVFSYALSPNARWALAERPHYAAAVAVTRVPTRVEADFPRVECVAIEGPDEGDLLVRVEAPALMTLWALRATLRPDEAAALDALGEVCQRQFERAMAHFAALPPGALDQLALVTDRCPESLFSLRWKWLESVATLDPPVWDLLSVAHGPLQAMTDTSWRILAMLEAGDPLSAALQGCVRAAGARCDVFVSPWRGDASFFVYDAVMNAAMLTALGHRPRDLAHWPHQGLDLPLYGLKGAPDEEP